MSASWGRLKLKDCCLKIGSGATPKGGKNAYLDHGEFRLIRSQNIHNNSFHHDGLAFISEAQAKELKSSEVQKDDVLLNITGDSVARSCKVREDVLPARVNQHVMIIRADGVKLHHDFLRYWLVSPSTQELLLNLAQGGATRNALTKGMIEDLEIPAMPFAEQLQLTMFLNSISDEIDILKLQNVTLESIAQTLFKSWFVNLDPIHAKAAGREPECMSAEIAALFPSEFEESELGLIPKGWRIKTVEQTTVRLKPAQVFSEDDCKDALGVPLFDQSSKIFVGYTEAEAKVESSEFNPAFLFGDHTCVMRLNSESFNISANVIPLKANQADGYWLYYAMKGLQKFESYRRHWSELKVKTLLIPSENLMASFGSVARDVHKKIENNEKLCFVLSRIRDELLPRLISGRIRIEEAEAALADVVPSTEKQVA